MKLGNTPARFMSQLCILKEISDGVETCREGKWPQAEPGLGLVL